MSMNRLIRIERQSDGYPIGMVCRVRLFDADLNQYLPNTVSVRVTSEPFRHEFYSVDGETGATLDRDFSAYGQMATMLTCDHEAVAREFLGEESFYPMYTLLPPIKGNG